MADDVTYTTIDWEAVVRAVDDDIDDDVVSYEFSNGRIFLNAGYENE